MKFDILFGECRFYEAVNHEVKCLGGEGGGEDEEKGVGCRVKVVGCREGGVLEGVGGLWERGLAHKRLE